VLLTESYTFIDYGRRDNCRHAFDSIPHTLSAANGTSRVDR